MQAPTNHSNTTIVILAAGACSRFGECKHLVQIDGKPLTQHLIDRCLSVVTNTIYVVSGCYHEQQATTLDNVEFIYNADWQEGLSSSIKAATKALSNHSSLLFLLGDQIALQKADIEKLLITTPSAEILCAEYAGKRGVPARFHHTQYEALTTLQGDQGAKGLLYNANCKAITMPNASFDIDTKADLGAYLEAGDNRLSL